jgi:hypothetical protein
MPTPLPHITTLARSGALDRAWALFREAGYEAETDNPAALAVKGRLLKDQALAANGADKWEGLALAASAYRAADALAPQPWLLINVAALTAMQGKQTEAKALADEVLFRIAPGQEVAETPYWQGATRAEAFLIKGMIGEADAALTEARALDADGYEDHASTLKQFTRLIAATKGSTDWLDKHRPPASLHFAGHLGIAPDQTGALRHQVDAILTEQRIGFGYGALAAGADIVIAEALIAHGVELHLILPTALDDFVALSVVPFGREWQRRFEQCHAAAKSVHVSSSTGRQLYEPLATALSADLAMGAAMLNARRLESKALQLLVIDEDEGPFGGGTATARDGKIWAKTGQKQHVIKAPRTAKVSASSTRQEGRRDRRLAALLRLDFEGLEGLDDGTFAQAMDEHITPFFARAAKLEGKPFLTQPHGNGRVLGFAEPRAAALYAKRLMRLDPPVRWPLRLCGHYGLVTQIDQIGGGQLIGPALSALDDIALGALAGTLTVSENFATALQVTSGEENHHSAQYIGDVFLRSAAAETRLFTLTL